MAFDYGSSVRTDIGDAHKIYWQTLTKPGNWFTSAQRIAIAAASREAIDCVFCAARKTALSPYTMKGEHDSQVDLPPLVLDAVHRIITDQTRITKHYIDSNEQDGLSKPAYVELVGVVVAMFSIDEFHRAMGLPLEVLPESGAGEPDHYQPKQAVIGTGFVPMISPEGTTGQEADLWRRGRTANVVRALSLVPNAVRDWVALSNAQYLSFEGMSNFTQPEGRSINRMQIELVAGRVSAINECFY
ncbi:MAG: hypothetical protein ACJAXW_003213 [Candidatus Azotimanducaceae bacterium]|jgi:hypothetical protein